MKVKVINKSKNPLPKHETLMSAGMDVRGDFGLFQGEFLVGDSIGALCAVAEVDSIGKPTKIVIAPSGRLLIPTGLYIELPEGHEMQVRPRSGLALKQGLTVLNSPGTIDADYRGECGTILTNTSTEMVEIADGERICQWVLNKYSQVEWEDTDELSDTVRGKGGFGHSGKQ